MAEANENGGAAANPAAATAGQPTLSVIAQYVKDLSFENPDAPNSLRAREKPPQISTTINVHANPLTANDFEVELRLEARARDDDKVVFAADVVYAGVFRILNVPQEQIHRVIMIECPQLLFPFARQILAEASRNGGFPPLMIQPVDFIALYRQRAAQAGAAPVPPAANA
jgi:preprotein translocase subunit SecB